MSHERRDERGAISVLVACLLVVAALFVWLVLGSGALVARRAHATAAADAAALAAADALANGLDSGTACADAARFATANGATLRQCDAGIDEVTVLVESAPGPPNGRAFLARARAVVDAISP